MCVYTHTLRVYILDINIYKRMPRSPKPKVCPRQLHEGDKEFFFSLFGAVSCSFPDLASCCLSLVVFNAVFPLCFGFLGTQNEMCPIPI